MDRLILSGPMTQIAAILRRALWRKGVWNPWLWYHFQDLEIPGPGFKENKIIHITYVLKAKLKKLFINRYLLESLSGVLTGSIYHDGGMAKKFVGELGKFEINENATNTYVSQNKF